jgi:glutathione peroxidase
MKQIIIALFVIGTMLTAQTTKESGMAPFYTYTMKTIDGKDKSLADYKGKVVMVVNVASFCGYTPQYKDLEAIYKKYNEKGFVILGFPANNFGKQEPGKDEDIATFCERNYGVTFELFSKISVKGDDMHPLYQYLTKETGEEIGWNFTKIVIDKEGNISGRYASRVKPNAQEVVAKIESLLAQK